MTDIKILEGMIYSDPLGLLTLEGEDKDFVNNLLPYSIGMEFECYQKPTYSRGDFERIPGIMAIDVSTHEQRYRIPNGIAGLIALHFIAIEMKFNSEINTGSGIHYHVDCIGYKLKDVSEIAARDQEEILTKLESWGPEINGSRKFGSWFRCNELGTLEFRVGEMTFEYKELLKCIMDATSIVRKIRIELGEKELKFPAVDINQLIIEGREVLLRGQDVAVYLQKKLQEAQNALITIAPPLPPSDSLESMRQIIKNRTQKI